jgi:formylglycine-generating enzyme required for sulfatase activity/serine/threonine protein kinase
MLEAREIWLRDALPRGTFLHGYEIEMILGRGGFGITYRVRDRLDQVFAVKECFPKQFAVRLGLEVLPTDAHEAAAFADCRDRFMREAKALTHLSQIGAAGDGVVKVMTLFEAYGTAYMVMEYLAGQSMETLIKLSPPGIDGKLLGDIFWQLLRALGCVHEAGLLHRDLKPGNIFLRDDGRPVLIDFGAARAADTSDTVKYTQIYSHSYAPIEQFSGGRQGRFSDLYALGMTGYQAIGGSAVDAYTRQQALMRGKGDPLKPAVEIGAGRYSQSLLKAIDAALAVAPDDRPQSAAEMLTLIGDNDRPTVLVLEPMEAPAEADAPAPIERYDDPKTPPAADGLKSPVPRAELHSRVWSSLVAVRKRAARTAAGILPWIWGKKAVPATRHLIAGVRILNLSAAALMSANASFVSSKAFRLSIGAAVLLTVVAVGVGQWPNLERLLLGDLATASMQSSPAPTFRDCRDCPEMVTIAGGRFLMGTPAAEEGRLEGEPIPHRVSVSSFALGKYPVTFAEWDACVADGGCNGYLPPDLGWGRGNHPVINVSWDHAQRYIKWLNSKVDREGQLAGGKANHYRLPSEAEWEYAARAGTATARYWGEAIGSGNANCDGCGSKWGGKQTAPVGSFSPNGWGLYDMLGNAFQWTADCWHPSYAGAPTDGTAWATGDCAARVIRGGSWTLYPRYLRSASRQPYDAGARGSDSGFRVARALP